MRIFPSFLFLIFFLAVGSPSALRAQPQQGPTDGTALQFVRTFYDWYVPAQAKSDERGVELVLKRRRAVLSKALLQALQQDAGAQARAKGEIDGLDFDPFLNSQDPAKSYAARRVRREGERAVVPVYGSGQTAKGGAPDIEVVLEPQGGSWLISDFRYPDHGNLLGLLRRLHGPPKQN